MKLFYILIGYTNLCAKIHGTVYQKVYFNEQPFIKYIYIFFLFLMRLVSHCSNVENCWLHKSLG